MKIMSRDFTTREKIMLLVLTLILLAAGYYACLLYTSDAADD